MKNAERAGPATGGEKKIGARDSDGQKPPLNTKNEWLLGRKLESRQRGNSWLNISLWIDHSRCIHAPGGHSQADTILKKGERVERAREATQYGTISFPGTSRV